MEIHLAYARMLRAVPLALALAAGCGSVDEDEASTDSKAGYTDESNAVAAGGEEGDDDSASEPPLDPTRNYPGAATVLDAGGAAAGRPATQPPPSVTVPPGLPPAEDVVVAEPVNPFVDATKDPFSTFGADVDTASYDYLRQGLLQSRTLPTPGYVRVEDYVNYFDYAYPVPAADAAQPFAIALSASPHPLGRTTTLLRVGIQAKAAPVEAPRPANVVFLVDVSGSMASPDKLPLVQQVLTEALNVLQQTDKVSIVTYAGDTRVRLGPTLVSSRDAITGVIAGLSAGGGTNGASGIQLAYEQASAGFIQGGINHVILCTDGDFNLGVTSDDALVALIKQKRATGVTLTALGFGRDNLNDGMMEKVSNAGNGSYSLVYDQDQAIEYANERLLATIVHVAKDMKIQVEFNPTQVIAYRLVGYEDRAIADASFRDDRVDGGEVGAEHRVTALYELVLAGSQLPAVSGAPALSAGDAAEALTREVDPSELVRVKVRSKAVTATDADPASEVVASLKPADAAAAADPDLAWAAAVAGFAELLRASPYARAAELDAIDRIAASQQERDSDRAEFVQLLSLARPLMSTPVTGPQP